jgi:Ring finger domain
MPCLDEECVKKNEALTLGAKGDDYCIICYTDGLSQAPCIQLDCKHIAHLDCIMQRVKTSWIGARITFNFMDCPACKKELKADYCIMLKEELRPLLKLKEKVIKKALERAVAEGIDKDERLFNPDDEYFNDLPKYVMARLSFYMCYTCNDPYYGGKRECG